MSTTYSTSRPPPPINRPEDFSLSAYKRHNIASAQRLGVLPESGDRRRLEDARDLLRRASSARTTAEANARLRQSVAQLLELVESKVGR